MAGDVCRDQFYGAKIAAHAQRIYDICQSSALLGKEHRTLPSTNLARSLSLKCSGGGLLVSSLPMREAIQGMDQLNDIKSKVISDRINEDDLDKDH